MELIRDLTEIKRIVLDKIKTNFDFVKDTSGPGMLEDTGRLFCKFKLTDLRSWTGRIVRSEIEDGPILTALTNLCKNGRLVIFDARYHKNLEFHDVIFSCEIGIARRIYKGVSGPEIVIDNLYSKKAISPKKRMASRSILDVKKVCERLKKIRDAKFKKQFGDSGLEVESQLHKETIEDELQLKRRLFKAIEKVERMAAE